MLKLAAKRSVVVVPVTAVSRRSVYAISGALSLSEEVVAVNVMLDSGSAGEARAQTLEQEWAAWGSGVPLRVLHTDYASIVSPLCSFADELRSHDDK